MLPLYKCGIGAVDKAAFYESGTVTSPESFRQVITKTVKKHRIKALRYLDLGGADGTLATEIAKLVDAKETWIVDVSQSALNIAAARGLKTLCMNIDGERLPFETSYFDLVSMVEVIEHLVDTDKSLEEAFRVLRSDGYFLISTPNLASWRNRILLLLGFHPEFVDVSHKFGIAGPVISEVSSGHLRLYTLKALRYHLSYVGFKIVEVIGAATMFTRAPRKIFYRTLGFLDKLLSKRASLAVDLIILAKKPNTSQESE